MPHQSPFKHHRFPRDMILRAVRWYLHYPLSYQDVVDMLAERGVTVDRSAGSRSLAWNLQSAPSGICAQPALIST